jgi:hypothetical protein
MKGWIRVGLLKLVHSAMKDRMPFWCARGRWTDEFRLEGAYPNEYNLKARCRRSGAYLEDTVIPNLDIEKGVKGGGFQ